MDEAKSAWVQGWMAPVEHEMTSAKMLVSGEIPRELNGQLVRIGPNPIGDPGPRYHWFSGEGMVHSIRLEDGRALEYRNRWVRTPDVCAKLDEQCALAELDFFDVANTNVVEFGGSLYALTETCTPYRLGRDLSTLGRDHFGLDRPPRFAAHPHRDPVSGDWHAVGYGLDDRAEVEHFVIGPDRKAKSVSRVALGGPASAHDFGMTQSHILLFDLPVVFDRALADDGLAVPYRWSPSHAPRIGVLPRDGSGGVRWFDVSPCWVFHTMNAYDVTNDAGEVTSIVWDVVRFERLFESDVTGPNDPYPPQLYRWEIDLRRGTVTETEINGRVQEFPRIDERRWSQPYRYGFTTEIMNADGGSGILAYDLASGAAESYELPPGFNLSEPVFVPRSESAAENDGWLLALVHDDAAQASELIVLAAGDVAGGPVARVGLPQRVPAGFHGNWVGA